LHNARDVNPKPVLHPFLSIVIAKQSSPPRGIASSQRTLLAITETCVPVYLCTCVPVYLCTCLPLYLSIPVYTHSPPQKSACRHHLSEESVKFQYLPMIPVMEKTKKA
jgi:hypothetical protein